jgi:non-ribosomal peptide synthetase component F
MTRDRALQGLQVPPVGLSEAGPVAGTAVTLTPGALWFDAARIGGAAARDLAARIAHVAAQIATRAPEVPLSALSALTEAEREELLVRRNATARDHDRALMVHTAFEAQVARSPEAVAISFEGRELTYAQLNARANRVAHVLMGMGVGPGVLVGLCLRRSLDLVVGALAIQKAGGAYVPMDPAYPADRLSLYAEDSGAPVIVTQSDLAERFAVQTLCLDSDGRLAQAAEANPAAGRGLHDLYQRIDGAAQGGAGRAPQRGELLCRDGRAAGHRGGGLAGRHLAFVRHLGAGAVLDAGARVQGGDQQ